MEKLVLTAEGITVFDELCLRLDVNQKYADILPQWKELAQHLNIDQLMTKWVEVCVRPKEGLTRAILEIYMKDGGTLGEVLAALLELGCLDILELTKPKLEKYIKFRDSNEFIISKNVVLNKDNYFSILKTLIMALGEQDPCKDLHQFSNGLKNGCSLPIEHSILVQNSSQMFQNNCPHYQSNLHLNIKSKLVDKDEHSILKKNTNVTCKVLLIFAEDGISGSEITINISRTVNEDEEVIFLKMQSNFSILYVDDFFLFRQNCYYYYLLLKVRRGFLKEST